MENKTMVIVLLIFSVIGCAKTYVKPDAYSQQKYLYNCIKRALQYEEKSGVITNENEVEYPIVACYPFLSHQAKDLLAPYVLTFALRHGSTKLISLVCTNLGNDAFAQYPSVSLKVCDYLEQRGLAVQTQVR